MSVCKESRGGRNVQHQFVALLRQSVYSRLAGYEDTNDAERLSDDPTMRVIVGRRDTDRPGACQEVGVSTCRGGSVPGDVPASVGAYRRAPSSTRVAIILEVIRGEERQPRARCAPGDWKGVQTW